MFANIDRKSRQVFPWGINTLTFPTKEWGAEPTPHSPPSREGSGGGGFGREPTPHCRVIYSYIHKKFLRERAPQWYVVVLKRAPQCRFVDHENELYFNLFTQKSAALPCSWKWSIFNNYSQKSAAQPYLNYGVLINKLYSKEYCIVLCSCSLFKMSYFI